VTAIASHATVRDHHYPPSPPTGVCIGILARTGADPGRVRNEVALKRLYAIQHLARRDNAFVVKDAPLQRNLNVLAVIYDPHSAGAYINKPS